MRWMWFLAAALAASPPAAADAVLQGYGPYRFGMSVAEAQAADPSLQMRDDHGADLTILRSPNPTLFGAVRINPILSFRSGHLNQIVFELGGTVRRPVECAQVFDQVLDSLEQSQGIFNDVASLGEYGTPLPTRTTARGSTVRTYHYNGQLVSHANRRVGGWIELHALLADYPGAPPDTQFCLVNVEIRPQAPPMPPQLAPPSPEQLAAARAIAAPTWRDEPDSDTFEMTLPPYFPSGRVRIDVELDCLVIEDGRLSCAVAEESPPGQLWGQFAQHLSQAYRMESVINGEPTLGRRVRVPVELTLSGPGEAPPAPPEEGAREPVDLDALRALAAQAPSRAELDAAPLVERTEWTQRPDAQVFARFYPEAALRRRVSGRVVLDCLIAAEGRVRCAVSEEEPMGSEFGLAALGIAQDFRMATEIDGRSTIGKRVRVPIRFNVQ